VLPYETIALKVRGKLFLRVKDADTLVLMCPLEEKELLMEAAPHIYYETDHYKGWPAVLVRVAAVDEAELAHRVGRAWRLKAPKRLAAMLDAQGERKSKTEAATAPKLRARRRSRKRVPQAHASLRA
jgi:hypothetical protein